MGEVAQSCPTLCNPMDCSLPGPSVHGSFQAIVLEWIAISFSRGSSQPRDQTRTSYISCIGWRVLYHWRHLGSSHMCVYIYLHVVSVCVCMLWPRNYSTSASTILQLLKNNTKLLISWHSGTTAGFTTWSNRQHEEERETGVLLSGCLDIVDWCPPVLEETFLDYGTG